MITECANPKCSQIFEYRAGGSFFRFSKANADPLLSDVAFPEVGNVHDVEHYWLCSRCACAYTLVYHKGAGVLLKSLSFEDPLADLRKRLAVA